MLSLPVNKKRLCVCVCVYNELNVPTDKVHVERKEDEEREKMLGSTSQSSALWRLTSIVHHVQQQLALKSCELLARTHTHARTPCVVILRFIGNCCAFVGRLRHMGRKLSASRIRPLFSPLIPPRPKVTGWLFREQMVTRFLLSLSLSYSLHLVPPSRHTLFFSLPFFYLVFFFFFFLLWCARERVEGNSIEDIVKDIKLVVQLFF